LASLERLTIEYVRENMKCGELNPTACDCLVIAVLYDKIRHGDYFLIFVIAHYILDRRWWELLCEVFNLGFDF